MTHNAVLIVLDALAVFRLTRLILDDSITAFIRNPIVKNGPDKAMELFTCPWCMSVWMAAAVVALQSTVPSLWIYPAAVLAFSAVAGLLEGWH